MVTMGTKSYKARGNFHKFAYNLQNGNCKNYSMIKLLCKYRGVGRCQIFQVEKLPKYKIRGLETNMNRVVEILTEAVEILKIKH